MDRSSKCIECENHELKKKGRCSQIVELESSAQSKTRSLISELESTIRFLEEQNIAERQESHSATMQLRRAERRLRHVTIQLEEEKRNVENQKELAEKNNLRAKQMRRELDEQEEEMARERAKSRNLQQKIDELTRVNEILTRENNSLRARAENRENTRLHSVYQILRSNDNLTRSNDDDDNIGTEVTESDRITEPMVTAV